ncbi:MAG: hypothetical protein WCT52_03850 [Candidatus Micrarchaeia archaeon]
MKQKNIIAESDGSIMPRKAELFGHFHRARLLFNNVFFKFPLSEKAIIRSFSRDPQLAYEKYSRRGADKNTLFAIEEAKGKFESALASDAVLAKEIAADIARVSSLLEAMEKRRESILETYVRLKPGLKNSEKDNYLGAIKEFDKAIRAERKRLSRLEVELSKAKNAMAMIPAIKTLKDGLSKARETNKSEIITD